MTEKDSQDTMKERLVSASLQDAGILSDMFEFLSRAVTQINADRIQELDDHTLISLRQTISRVVGSTQILMVTVSTILGLAATKEAKEKILEDIDTLLGRHGE